MDHPKVGALSDGAFRLWVQGLTYCQKHLTDGFIAAAFVRGLTAYSAKRVEALVTAGLWDRTEKGITVHDYLQWNDSKEIVLAKREDAKDRMRRLRSREQPTERSQNVLSEVKGSGKVKEGGAGETKLPPSSADDWFIECQALHGGDCGGSLRHHTQMLLDREKAKGA